MRSSDSALGYNNELRRDIFLKSNECVQSAFSLWRHYSSTAEFDVLIAALGTRGLEVPSLAEISRALTALGLPNFVAKVGIEVMRQENLPFIAIMTSGDENLAEKAASTRSFL